MKHLFLLLLLNFNRNMEIFITPKMLLLNKHNIKYKTKKNFKPGLQSEKTNN